MTNTAQPTELGNLEFMIARAAGEAREGVRLILEGVQKLHAAGEMAELVLSMVPDAEIDSIEPSQRVARLTAILSSTDAIGTAVAEQDAAFQKLMDK